MHDWHTLEASVLVVGLMEADRLQFVHLKQLDDLTEIKLRSMSESPVGYIQSGE